MKKELVEIDIDQIVIRSRIRENMGNLASLENSIRRLGLLYPPVVNHRDVLLAGVRRVQACRNLGMKRIPVFRVNVDAESLTALNIECDENLCREPLTGEELEKEIAAKKSFLRGGRRAEESLLGRLRRFFTGLAHASR